MSYDNIVVLIPAYKPDDTLLGFVDALLRRGFSRIVVVDDGSGAAYAPIFSALTGKADVLIHSVNRGKGAALKTGIAHILASPGASVITADADGQHSPEDCAKIADALIAAPGALIMGTRDKAQMPPRSKAGNSITCFMVGAMIGLWLPDTQTGLRGLPNSALPRFAALSGDRYEYELSMLIDARHRRMPVVPVGIETIYIDQNRGSHFNAARDGARIYALLFRQIAAYLGITPMAAVIDYVLYFALRLLLPGAAFRWVAVAVSRTAAGVYGRMRRGASDGPAHGRALFLLGWLAALLCSTLIIAGLARLGLPDLVAKPIADITLLIVGYKIRVAQTARRTINR